MMYDDDTLRDISERYLESPCTPTIFGCNIGDAVKGDYFSMINVGLDDQEAERRLLDHYHVLTRRGDINEANFWFAFALSEWKKGRMSPEVKDKAMAFLDSEVSVQLWEQKGKVDAKKRHRILDDLRERLNTPMPARKSYRARKPRRCPWNPGDLLSWKLTFQGSQSSLTQEKLALVRVVRILKDALCELAPEFGYDESPCLAFYDWLGDIVPSSQQIQQLGYAVINRNVMPLQHLVKEYESELLKKYPEPFIRSIVDNLPPIYDQTCEVILSQEMRIIPSLDIMVVENDSEYAENIPPELNTGITQMSITGLRGFEDSMKRILSQRIVTAQQSSPANKPNNMR